MICDDRWFFFEATSQSTALSGPSNKISTKTPTLCRVAELEPKSHQPNLSHLSYSKSLFCHSLFQVWSCLLPLVLVKCFTLRKTPGLRSPRHSLQEEPRTQMVTLPQKVDVRGCGWPRTVARTNHMNLSCSKNNYFTSSDPHHDMLGGGCQVRVVRKTSKPGMLFFTIFACSCRVLSATQNSTCQKCSSKQDTTICQNMSVYHLAERNMPKHATTNMPNHVRIPPVKNI